MDSFFTIRTPEGAQSSSTGKPNGSSVADRGIRTSTLASCATVAPAQKSEPPHRQGGYQPPPTLDRNAPPAYGRGAAAPIRSVDIHPVTREAILRSTGDEPGRAAVQAESERRRKVRQYIKPRVYEYVLPPRNL